MHKKIGIIGLKIGLTIVAVVVCAAIGGKLSMALTGSRITSLSIPQILWLNTIIPIWYKAPIPWRLAAAGAGIALGIGV